MLFWIPKPFFKHSPTVGDFLDSLAYDNSDLPL